MNPFEKILRSNPPPVYTVVNKRGTNQQVHVTICATTDLKFAKRKKAKFHMKDYIVLQRWRDGKPLQEWQLTFPVGKNGLHSGVYSWVNVKIPKTTHHIVSE